MALTKIQFKPGIDKEGTEYSADSGWFDADKVRFRKGRVETIGGWRKYVSTAIKGVARSLFDWGSADGDKYLGVGTNLKFYIESGGTVADVTPIRQTTSAGDVPLPQQWLVNAGGDRHSPRRCRGRLCDVLWCRVLSDIVTMLVAIRSTRLASL